MSFNFNPFTSNFDEVTKLDSPLQFKGSISVNTDFPLIADVKSGWFYTIATDVTDNAGATYTNTGQSFQTGDEIAWNGTNWTIMGNENINLLLANNLIVVRHLDGTITQYAQTTDSDTARGNILKSIITSVTSGDTVYVGAGDFYIGSKSIITNDITIIGAGDSTYIYGDVEYPEMEPQVPFYFDDVENVNLSNFKMAGFIPIWFEANSINNLNISNVNFVIPNPGVDEVIDNIIVQGSGVFNLSLRNCNMNTDVDTVAIFSTGGGEVLIDSCEMNLRGAGGLIFGNNTLEDEDVTNVLIKNTYINGINNILFVKHATNVNIVGGAIDSTASEIVRWYGSEHSLTFNNVAYDPTHITDYTDIVFNDTESILKSIETQVSELVPYTGATGDVDLGQNDITAKSFIINESGIDYSTITVAGGGEGNGVYSLSMESFNPTVGTGYRKYLLGFSYELTINYSNSTGEWLVTNGTITPVPPFYIAYTADSNLDWTVASGTGPAPTSSFNTSGNTQTMDYDWTQSLVPYTGATGDINIGANNFTTTGYIYSNELYLKDLSTLAYKRIYAQGNNMYFTAVHGIFDYSIGLRGNRGSTLGMESAGTDLGIYAGSKKGLEIFGATGIVGTYSDLRVAGKLGVGVVPIEKVEIEGAGTTRAIIRDSVGTGALRLVASGADAFIGSDSGDLFLQTDAVNRVRIDETTGNLELYRDFIIANTTAKMEFKSASGYGSEINFYRNNSARYSIDFTSGDKLQFIDATDGSLTMEMDLSNNVSIPNGDLAVGSTYISHIAESGLGTGNNFYGESTTYFGTTSSLNSVNLANGNGVQLKINPDNSINIYDDLNVDGDLTVGTDLEIKDDGIDGYIGEATGKGINFYVNNGQQSLKLLSDRNVEFIGSVTTFGNMTIDRSGNPNLFLKLSGAQKARIGSTSSNDIDFYSSTNKYWIMKANGDLEVTGRVTQTGSIKAISTKTSDYTITPNDYTILADATSNDIDITLPATPETGQIFNIKCVDATNTCTVDGNGNNIDGDATVVLILDETITIQYDGGDWRII